MSQDPNYPLTSRTAPEADRPAPGPEGAGDAAGTFPRDRSLEGQEMGGTTESGMAAAGGGAAREVDPGLEGHAPGGQPERPAWGQGTTGATESDLSRGHTAQSQATWDRTGQPGMGSASAGVGAPQEVDPGLADQAPGGPAERGSWEQSTAGGAGANPLRDEAEVGAGTDRHRAAGGAAGRPSLDRFRDRWPAVQGAFVDDPRNAVAEADRLLAEVIQEVEQMLTGHRRRIQDQMSGREQDTEQLRQSMHGYRALLQRLLETPF